MISSLQERQALEASRAVGSIDLAESLCDWQWSLETLDGKYIAGMCVVPNEYDPRRGWFVGYPGKAISGAGFELRPLFKLHKMLIHEMDMFDDLFAYVLSDDPIANSFAKWFGFAYEAGPIREFSPARQDLNIYRWSKDDELNIQFTEA